MKYKHATTSSGDHDPENGDCDPIPPDGDKLWRLVSVTTIARPWSRVLHFWFWEAGEN